MLFALIPFGLPLTTHVLTGCAGYICKEAMHSLLASRPSDSVIGLCRASRVANERKYWSGVSPRVEIQDIEEPIYPSNFTAYLLASHFSPGDEVRKARENVDSVRSYVSSLPAGCDGCVLLSSMASVRGPGQRPGPVGVFTSKDWNTVSALTPGSFGPSYQYSKTEQERAFNAACKERAGMGYTSLCPSLVLGPIRSRTQYGTSLGMLASWHSGEKECESRLIVDVRDVANAVVAAGDKVREGERGGRRIVSRSQRCSGSEIVGAMGSGIDGGWKVEGDEVRDDSAELGIVLRGWEETIKDSVTSLKEYRIL